MTQVCDTGAEPEQVGDQVFLNKERAIVNLGEVSNPYDATSYLDTGASNHMTGLKAAFTELDADVTGTVRFGDGLVVEIKGRGMVLFNTPSTGHRAMTRVYFIPRLKTNIISIGNLDENGCQTLVEDGFMCIRDRRRRLLAK